MLNRTPTVAVLALEHPVCVGVFLKHRIDFCCAGDVTVAEACAGRGLDATAVQAELDAAMSSTTGAPIADPRAVPTAALISHIVARHH